MKIVIPDGMSFSALRLARDADGAVSFDWAAIEKVCEASGIDPQVLAESDESNAAALVFGWYRAHRDLGGAIDPVAEDLIAEAAAEDALGGGISHQPGRA